MTPSLELEKGNLSFSRLAKLITSHEIASEHPTKNSTEKMNTDKGNRKT